MYIYIHNPKTLAFYRNYKPLVAKTFMTFVYNILDSNLSSHPNHQWRGWRFCSKSILFLNTPNYSSTPEEILVLLNSY